MKQKAPDLLDVFITVFGIGMVFYHMVSTQYLFVGTYEHQDIHLGFLLVLGFLSATKRFKNRWLWALQIVFILLSIFATVYVLVNIRHLEEVIGLPEPIDVVIGVILMILVIEATRQAWGLILPVVACLFVSYFFLGHLIPGALSHKHFTFDYVISRLSIGLSGIYGPFLSISANQVFLFVVFGSLLEVVKLNDFFYEAGKVAGRFLEGGPGHTAVISSSMVGMVSGASVANVAITGSFTIPYMKRVGYKPEQAGAIEATASTGGQIMPPIMGASAFLMAFFLGVPYVMVMLAGILPALFFYMSVALGVQLLAVSSGIALAKEVPDMKLIFRRLPLFLVPLTIIIILLLRRYSPMLAGFWAIIALVLLSYVYQDVRPKILDVVRCLSKGALVAARIGLSLAIVGMMAQTLLTTDLGIKFAGLVGSISGDNLVIALIVTMVISIILGCGIPTTAAYSLVALVVAPILVKMGVLPLSAHFFAFYFAIISALTPPVALCSLAASGIAGGKYFRTSLDAFKLAISGFIIPFLIVFNPVLLLRIESIPWAVGSLISIPIGLAALTTFIYNYGLVKFSLVERLICLATAVMMFGYCMFRHIKGISIEYPMFVMGMALFGILLVMQIRKKRSLSAVAAQNT